MRGDAIRPAAELAAVDDPAWPHVRSWIEAAAVDVRVLPAADEAARLRTLFRLQMTAWSTAGALVLNTGGLLVDHGWLRVLGSGAPGLPDVAAASGLGDPVPGHGPGFVVVGYDVLGGVFATNNGLLDAEPGETCYLAPDALEWTPLGARHSAWLRWALDGGLEEFCGSLRWPGWQDLTSTAAPGEGISWAPPPWTKEGHGPTVSRRVVPLGSVVELTVHMAQQIGGLPAEQTVRFPAG